jgi:tRNA threonylcarbamoyladenosine biosynthesis protein TsaE
MSDPLIVPLPDLAATETLARRLASIARAGDCILLEGPLGAGKTALARAFLREAAGDEAMEVPSPSFTLVQIYDTKIGPTFHYDLWRLDGPDSLAELDWEEALDAIVLVEWPDRLGPLQPSSALTITLRMGEGEEREATLTGWEERMAPLALVSWPGVFQPSTLDRAGADGRDTPGHDDETKTDRGHGTDETRRA